MPEWQKNYFVGGRIRDPEEIRRKIEEGRPVIGVYLLTLPHNPDNLLELLPALNLVQRHVRENCPRIIGVAQSKEEAMELSRGILMECYQKTGAFQLDEYLKNR